MAADDREVTLLALLDLSAAFDCVNHDILLSRLRSNFGLAGTVLACIRSFLTDKTQHVSFGGLMSAEIALLFGVPQGSVLGETVTNLGVVFDGQLTTAPHIASIC